MKSKNSQLGALEAPSRLGGGVLADIEALQESRQPWFQKSRVGHGMRSDRLRAITASLAEPRDGDMVFVLLEAKGLFGSVPIYLEPAAAIKLRDQLTAALAAREDQQRR